MVKKVSAFVISLVILFTVILAGCGNSAPPASGNAGSQATQSGNAENQGTSAGAGGFTIEYMTDQSRIKDSMKDMATKIKGEHDITVNFQVVPDNQFQSLLFTKINSSDVPDIVDVTAPEMLVKYDGDTNFLDLSDTEVAGRLNSLETFQYSGKLLAVPYSPPSSMYGVYYNKTVFNDLGITEPSTQAEFQDALKAVQEKGNGIVPLYFSNKDTWTTQIAMISLFASALDNKGEDTYRKIMSGELEFGAVPEYGQSLSEFQSFFTNNYVNANHSTATYDDAKNALGTGEAAMIISGEFAIKDIVEKYPDNEYGFFPLRMGNVNKATTANLSYSIAAMKSGKQTDNAKGFLDIWTSPDYMSIYYASIPTLSPYKDIESSPMPAVLEEGYAKYLETNQVVYQMNDIFAPASAYLGDTLWNTYVMVALGKDVNEAVKEIDTSFKDFAINQGLEGF